MVGFSLTSAFSIAARYIPDPLKMVARSVFGCRNDPAQVEARMMEFKGQIACDVGANDGWTSKLLTNGFRRVIAFEPYPDSFDKLFRLVRLYGSRISAVEMAVGAENGEIWLSQTSLSQKVGMFVEPEMRHHWGRVNGKMKVRITTLDEYFKDRDKPDFVKIDVEGMEAQVLEGMRGLIRDKMPRLFIEMHSRGNGEMIKRSLDASYTFDVMRHPSLRTNSEDWKDHYWLICRPF